MIKIVQRHPARYSQFNVNHPLVKDRSPTNSLESFNNLANKEKQILQRNYREAKYEFVIHFCKVLDVPELKEKRDKVFGYLRKVGLNAALSIEPTTDGFDNPTDTVHFHGLTDDERGVDFLRELCRTACLAAGLQDKAVSGAPKNEFDIECRPLDDGYEYLDYFTKYEMEDKVYLFIRGSRIQRFYCIGDWFIDADGNRRNKGEIWEEIKQETRERHHAHEEEKKKEAVKCRLKKSEKFITLNSQKVGRQLPTDHTKLKEVLDKKTDATLYDWYSILLAKPTLFHTIPPRWLTEILPSQVMKCNDLLDAAEERIRCSNNSDIIFALEIYHGIKPFIPDKSIPK
jgi:hypothetical protein